MMWALLLAAAAMDGAEETPWAAGQTFADAAACTAHLDTMIGDLREAATHEIVRGPYEIATGDVRFHAVVPEGAGHRISEYRCLGAEFASRSWTHELAKAEEKSWLESAAERLNKDAAEKQQ